VPSWLIRSPQAQSFAVVPARLNLLAPGTVFDVPTHRVAQAVLERMPRRPPQLATDLAGIDRVAPIVSGAIGDERLERLTARRSA
jgi:hypothetical protein